MTGSVPATADMVIFCPRRGARALSAHSGDVTTTLAPSAVSRRAIAVPVRPWLAPVTLGRAELSRTLKYWRCLLCGGFVEFGIFLNGYIPGPGAHDTDWEHRQLMREAEYAIFADKHNWKYAWFGEHHCLTEYSHMSAPEVVMGYVAGQHRLHPPRHPASTACRRARSTRSASPSAPRCSTTSRTAASSGAPAAAPAATRWPASTSSTRTPPRPSGTRSSARSRACGSRSTTTTTASTSPCRRRTTSCRSRTARVTRRSGSRAATRRPSQKAGELGHRRDRVQLRADLQPARAASRPTRRASRSAPSRSASS